MRSMRQEFKECVHLWSRIIPFKKIFPQTYLADDVFLEKERAAGGQTDTERGGTCRSVFVSQSGWVEAQGLVMGERINFGIT